MLTFHDIEQNTDEWHQMRCGRLTSSSLSKVMANYGKPFGDPAKALAIQIAVQQITGKPSQNSFSNAHTDRGHEQEPIARMLYEAATFTKVNNGGFFSTKAQGASPDGLIALDGVIEIKSQIAAVHYADVNRKNLKSTYKWQCVGNLKFTERDWIDYVSYCAEFPEDNQLYVKRIHKDDCKEDFEKIDLRVEEFMPLIDEAKETILNSNYFN